MKAANFISLVTLICVIFLFSGSSVLAGKKKSKNINVSSKVSLVDILKLAKNKKVHTFIKLKNGTTYSVKELKEVSNHAVVLRGPGGKEFYDVYVPISSIEAIEVRVKN